MQPAEAENAVASTPERAEDFAAINRRSWTSAQCGLVYGTLYGGLYGAILTTANVFIGALASANAASRPYLSAEPPPLEITISFAIFGGLAGVLFGSVIGYLVGVMAAKDRIWMVAARRLSIVACTAPSAIFSGCAAISMLELGHGSLLSVLIATGWVIAGLTLGYVAGHSFSRKVCLAAISAAVEIAPHQTENEFDIKYAEDFAAINRRSWSLTQFGVIYGCLYGLVYGAILATLIGWTITLTDYDALSSRIFSDGRLALALKITLPAAVFGGFVGIVLGPVIGYIVGALAAKDCGQTIAVRRTSVVATALASALLCGVETFPLIDRHSFSISIGVVAAGCMIASLAVGAFVGRLFSNKMLRAAHDVAAREAEVQLAAAEHAAERAAEDAAVYDEEYGSGHAVMHDNAAPVEAFSSLNFSSWSLAKTGLVYGCFYGILYGVLLATAIGLSTTVPYSHAWSRSDFTAARIADAVRITISFAIFGGIAGGMINMAIGYISGLLIARDVKWGVATRGMSMVACAIASATLSALELIALANGPHDRSAFGVLTIGWLIVSLAAGAIAGKLFSAKVLRAANDAAANKENATTTAQQLLDESAEDFGSLNRRSWAMSRRGLLYGALFGSATGALLAVTLTSTIVSDLTIGICKPGQSERSLPRVCPLLPLAVVAGVGSLFGEASGAIVGFIVAVSAANPRIGAKATRSFSIVLSVMPAIFFTVVEISYASTAWRMHYFDVFALAWPIAGIAFGAIAGALLANKLLCFAPQQRLR